MMLNAQKVTVQTAYTEGDLYDYVQKQRHLRRSLRAIAEDFGNPINHADIQRILDGVFPVGVEKRLALGLPAYAVTQVCTACGQVHAYDRACEMRVTVRPKRPPRPPRDLWAMPVELLRWKLENRS